ncbi:MAG: primosomal protein N', partial [Acidimicrobiia bacterium]|nr:primosomal protein N' [Acidimicrobiia bacterium]
MSLRLVSVAVPVPFLDVLTYIVPDELPMPPVGARVVVPLGSRQVTGCVMSHEGALDEGSETRAIARVLDDEPLLSGAIVELCRWVAEYYMAGIGSAVAAALPPGAGRRASGFRTRPVVVATAAGLEPGARPPTAKQRAALEVIAA